MESLLVNTIIGFWLVAFGAMALFPLVIDLRSDSTAQETLEEDQVISIQPVAIRHQITPVEQPMTAGTADGPGTMHPIHHRAA